MGRWGSRHCGHCGKSGHNRRTCPSLKEYIKENPDSWTARQHKRKQENYSARVSGKQRKCSYCQAVGHNRRTCNKLTDDVEIGKHKLEQHRSAVVLRAAEIGLGIGSLIRVSQPSYLYSFNPVDNSFKGEYVANTIWLVKEYVSLESVSHLRRVHNIIVECVTSEHRVYGNKEKRPVMMLDLAPRMFDPDLYDYASDISTSLCKIVGPVSAESAKASFPKGWVYANKKLVEDYYKDRY